MADEDGLLKYLRAEKHYQPTVTDHRIRLLFWQEVEGSLIDGRIMNPCNFHSLVCTETLFRNLFLRQPHRAAFLLCKPVAYEVAVREGLIHGINRLREILDMPHVDGKGNPNVKMLELKLKVTAMLDMRLHGAPKQSIQQLNVHMDATKKGIGTEVRTLVQKGDLDTIRKRIHEIEQEQRKIEGRSPEPQILEPELVPAKNGGV